MFLEMIAVLIAGLGGAGVMLLLSKLSGNRLPRWAIPVGAGAAMLTTAISSEYSWYGRTAQTLPMGMEVAQTVETSAFWRPWSYLAPVTERFAAIDMTKVRPNQDTEGLVMVDMYLFGRWKPVSVVQILINCIDRNRADPAFGDNSEPVWRDVPIDDPIVTTVCGPAVS